jgi:hypothetical protein
LKVILQLYIPKDIIRRVKRLNKLLLAFFVILFFNLYFVDLSNAQDSGIDWNCSNTGEINVMEYVAPRCDGGNCPHVGSSSVGEGFAYIGNVDNWIEWVDDSKFKQHSNDIHFLYGDAGDTIKFYRDTIWGGGNDSRFTCQESGAEAFYQVYDESGNWGRSILKARMHCGDTHTSNGFLKAFEKTPSMETNMSEGPFTECTVPGQSNIPTSGTQQLIFEGTAICNDLNPIDVIITTNIGGAGAGEVYVYCKGYGLCAWYQTIDFEENSPADWDESTDVCALEAGITDSLNRDPYFVEPIEAIYDYEINGYSDDGNLIFDKVYEDLVAQGYQAYCSIPNLQYIASDNTNSIMLKDIIGISDSDGMDEFGEMTTGNRVYVDLKDYKQFYDYIDSQTPLWRNKGVYVLKDKDSLENFWSHKNEDEVIGLIPIDYSPAFSVTSPEDQCREKKKIIAAVDKKCKTLENPETCALNISYDPDSISYWNLFKIVEETGFDCASMNTPNEELNQTQLDIKQSFLEMPFILPTAYRYAFAVYSAELREPRVPSEVGFLWTDTNYKPGFDFLRYDENVEPQTNQEAKPRSEVRILAFLVPDFATNQDDFNFTYTPPPEIRYPNPWPATGTPRAHVATYPEPNYDWHDSLKIARNALQTIEVQNKYEELWKAKKEREIIPHPFEIGTTYEPFKEVTELFNPDDEEEKLIECLYWHGHPTAEQYSCVEPLEKALTTFVNRRMENPEDCDKDVVEWEKNSEIYDDAGIERSDAALFHLYNGSTVHTTPGLEPYTGESVHMLDNGLFPNDVAHMLPNKADQSNGPIEDPRKQVFEFKFLSHYAFSSFYDGKDPIDRVTAEPPKDEDTKAIIHGYIVYPVGYELEGAEETILRSFLNPEEIAQFEEEFEEDERDIWFKMEGVKQSMPGKTAEYPEKFMHVTEGDCQQKYQDYVAGLSPDQSPMDYGSYKDQNCKKNPEANIESEPQTDKEPRILGARFGLITIKLQQTLRKVNTPSWHYITSCLESDTPTEDFLTGRCSGLSEGTGRVDPEEEPDNDYMNTPVATCTGSDRIINSIGGYELPPSDISCTIDDSMDSEQGSDSCDPNDSELVSNCAVEYSDINHGINNWLSSSDTVNCDDAFFSFVACSFNEDSAYRPSLIAHLVDEQGNFTPNGSKTACQYVQDRAAEQSVSPRLALSIWLEETGASAYSTETGGPDFGVLSAPTSRESGSIEPQLRLFLGTINSNRNIGYPRFLLQYSGEYLYGTDPDKTWRYWEEGDPVLFCRNRGFAGRLKNFYEQLGSF